MKLVIRAVKKRQLDTSDVMMGRQQGVDISFNVVGLSKPTWIQAGGVEVCAMKDGDQELFFKNCSEEKALALLKSGRDSQKSPLVVVEPILNLTQHVATAEQIETGVVEPADKMAIQSLLTFDEIPSSDDVFFQARELASIAYDWRYDVGLVDQPLRVMIGGAPFLMAQLEAELQRLGFMPAYAFSKRVSEESIDSEGNIIKTNVFKHVGFVTLD